MFNSVLMHSKPEGCLHTKYEPLTVKELSGLRRGSDAVRLVFGWLNYLTIQHWLMNLSFLKKKKDKRKMGWSPNFYIIPAVSKSLVRLFFSAVSFYIAWCCRCRCHLSSEATAPVSHADTFTIDLILLYLAGVFLSPAFIHIHWWC